MDYIIKTVISISDLWADNIHILETRAYPLKMKAPETPSPLVSGHDLYSYATYSDFILI